jgi:hypothetical protein
MALQMQTFTGFTPPMMAAFAQKIAKDTGVQLKGNEGTVTHGSFEFTYSYDPTAGVLQIQCLKKPLFIPASTIINGIAEEVADLIAATKAASSIGSVDIKATPQAQETQAVNTETTV